jgi:hypothetical protein
MDKQLMTDRAGDRAGDRDREKTAARLGSGPSSVRPSASSATPWPSGQS